MYNRSLLWTPTATLVVPILFPSCIFPVLFPILIGTQPQLCSFQHPRQAPPPCRGARARFPSGRAGTFLAVLGPPQGLSGSKSPWLILKPQRNETRLCYKFPESYRAKRIIKDVSTKKYLNASAYHVCFPQKLVSIFLSIHIPIPNGFLQLQHFQLRYIYPEISFSLFSDKSVLVNYY